jgi:hypothetical protein
VVAYADEICLLSVVTHCFDEVNGFFV